MIPMRRLLVCGALLFPMIVDAGCTVTGTGTGKRPQLLELYTSEGCNSCPPADAWLSELHSGDDVVPMAFHVDYWDGPRWRDRFAVPGYTARQRGIAKRSKTEIYTPQVALDGLVWRGWHNGGRLAAQAAAAQLDIELRPEPLSVRWSSRFNDAAVADRFAAFFVLLEDGLTSNVRGGENAGKILHHDHVVRAFAGPKPASSGDAELRVKSDAVLARSRLVAWLQDTKTGEVAQLVQIALADCLAPPAH